MHIYSSKVMGHLVMTESTKAKTITLSDAYKDLLQVVKAIANNDHKEKQYSILTEVSFINFKV
jgi:hypothetical protein